MEPRVSAIVGATVLAGRDLVPIPDGVVVITDNSISAVGSAENVTVPDGAGVIDGRGRTVIPGFIDAHVHIGFYEPSDVLRGGVTTVRDLAWPPERIAPLAEASRADDFAGPTILAAGPMLTAPGGYPMRAAWAPPGTGLEVASPGAARAAVARVVEMGGVIVKVALNPPVGPVLDLDTLRAIVGAAHGHGLKVTGHVHGLAELDKALDAGMDELAHMLMSNESIPRATIDRMVTTGMVVVPTLSVFTGIAAATAIANLAAFRAAGGRIVYGTDLGNAGPRPGIDPTEVAAMAAAGMTGLDIIRAATIDAAGCLGLDLTASIEAGYDADIVIVNGDPSAEPQVLSEVVAVWRRGVRAR